MAVEMESRAETFLRKQMAPTGLLPVCSHLNTGVDRRAKGDAGFLIWATGDTINSTE